MDEGQDIIETFPGIAQDFIDEETWETLEQLLEARDGEQVVVAVGRGERTAQRPEGEQAVIDDIEGLGLVAEMMLATGL